MLGRQGLTDENSREIFQGVNDGLFGSKMRVDFENLPFFGTPQFSVNERHKIKALFLFGEWAEIMTTSA